jgi:hypothetical protein
MAASNMSAASSDFVLRDRQRRRDTQHVAVEPALADQQPSPLARFVKSRDRCGIGVDRTGTTVSSASIKPLPRNSAIHGQRARHGASRLRRYSPARQRIRLEIVVEDVAQRGVRRGDRDRIAAEGGESSWRGSRSSHRARAITPPNGSPLAMPFANVIMSGTIPCA